MAIPEGEEEEKRPEEEGEEAKKPEEEKKPEEILPEHPDGTVSYLVCKVYGSWLEEFASNLLKYGTCMRNMRLLLEGNKIFLIVHIAIGILFCYFFIIRH